MAAKSRDFVLDYDKIREILRLIFFYGCYTADDFKKEGISYESYNQYKRIIEAFFNTQKQTINRKKAIFFNDDMFNTDFNFLYDTYSIKRCVYSKIALCLVILQIMSDGDKRTKNKLLDDFSDNNIEISESSMYRQLAFLCDIGYINQEEVKNETCYELANDVFAQYDESQLLSILNCIDLMRNLIPPFVCGNFAFETLMKYNKESQKKDVDYINPFMIKNNYFGQVLDDNIVWRILCAVNEKKLIGFLYQQKKFSKILPIKLNVDYNSGRRYLFAIQKDLQNQPILFRLDKMSELEITKVSFSDDEYAEGTIMYKENMRYSVAGSTLLKPSKPIVVEFTCSVEMRYIVECIFPNCKITENDNDILVTILTNTALELKPKLRTIWSGISNFCCDDNELVQALDDELQVWRAMYGIV